MCVRAHICVRSLCAFVGARPQLFLHFLARQIRGDGWEFQLELILKGTNLKEDFKRNLSDRLLLSVHWQCEVFPNDQDQVPTPVNHNEIKNYAQENSTHIKW